MKDKILEPLYKHENKFQFGDLCVFSCYLFIYQVFLCDSNMQKVWKRKNLKSNNHTMESYNLKTQLSSI